MMPLLEKEHVAVPRPREKEERPTMLTERKRCHYCCMERTSAHTPTPQDAKENYIRIASKHGVMMLRKPSDTFRESGGRQTRQWRSRKRET